MSEMTPELRAEIMELAEKLSAMCADYSVDATLFVLEAGLTQEIQDLSPTLGRLFAEMMIEYKKKAELLLRLTEALTGTGTDQFDVAI